MSRKLKIGAKVRINQEGLRVMSEYFTKGKIYTVERYKSRWFETNSNDSTKVMCDDGPQYCTTVDTHFELAVQNNIIGGNNYESKIK